MLESALKSASLKPPLTALVLLPLAASTMKLPELDDEPWIDDQAPESQSIAFAADEMLDISQNCPVNEVSLLKLNHTSNGLTKR